MAALAGAGVVVATVGAVAGTVAAIRIQKLGWQLEAKRILLQTLEDIEVRTNQPK